MKIEFIIICWFIIFFLNTYSLYRVLKANGMVENFFDIFIKNSISNTVIFDIVLGKDDYLKEKEIIYYKIVKILGRIAPILFLIFLFLTK